MFARLSPLVLLFGCAGSVTLEDVDGFGAATTASWIHIDYGDYETDEIVVTNVVNVCDKLQDFFDATNEVTDSANDVLDSDFCEEHEDTYQDFAAAGAALYHDGAHFLTLGVSDHGDPEPDEDTYEVGDPDHGLSGALAYFDDDPFQDIEEEWDPDAEVNDFCGLGTYDYNDEFADASDTWTLDDGELEFTKVDHEEVAVGKLDAELEDEDGDGAGDITASFTASWCEVK